MKGICWFLQLFVSFKLHFLHHSNKATPVFFHFSYFLLKNSCGRMRTALETENLIIILTFNNFTSYISQEALVMLLTEAHLCVMLSSQTLSHIPSYFILNITLSYRQGDNYFHLSNERKKQQQKNKSQRLKGACPRSLSQ